MEFMQREKLLKEYLEAESKVFRLGDFYIPLAREIEDPFGGTNDFEFCFRTIRKCCDNLLECLVEKYIQERENGFDKYSGNFSVLS